MTSTPTEKSFDLSASRRIGQRGPQGIERRRYARVQPDELNPFEAKLANGTDVQLIDLSRGGALFECARRFLPNAVVSLRLITRDDVLTIKGRVVRSRLVHLTVGGLGYAVAVAFSQPQQIQIEHVEPSTSEAEAETFDRPKPNVVASTGTPIDQEDAPESLDHQLAVDMTASTPADILPPSAVAIEDAARQLSALFTITASVDATADQLRDIFNGNDW